VYAFGTSLRKKSEPDGKGDGDKFVMKIERLPLKSSSSLSLIPNCKKKGKLLC